MKNFFSIILVLFAFCSLAAAGELNFTGEWQLNKDKSTLGEGRRGSRMATNKMIIDHKENLKIERHSVNRDGDEVTTEETLTLDGKECKNETNRGESVSKAKLSGDDKNLQIESTITFQGRNGEFQMDSKQTWSLEENGNVLVIDQTMTTPRGERSRKFYYDKVTAEKK